VESKKGDVEGGEEREKGDVEGGEEREKVDVEGAGDLSLLNENEGASKSNTNDGATTEADHKVEKDPGNPGEKRYNITGQSLKEVRHSGFADREIQNGVKEEAPADRRGRVRPKTAPGSGHARPRLQRANSIAGTGPETSKTCVIL
jgi:hypothetical protein